MHESGLVDREIDSMDIAMSNGNLKKGQSPDKARKISLKQWLLLLAAICIRGYGVAASSAFVYIMFNSSSTLM